MVIDKHFKNIVIIHARTLLAEKNLLTQDLYDKINAGDENIIRETLEEHKQEIIKESKEAKTENEKNLISSQAESVQKVLDSLTELLNANE